MVHLVSRTGIRVRHVLLLVVLGLAGAAVFWSAFAASSKADDIYYCQQTIYGYTSCPQHANGYFNANHAYVPGAHFGGVCEKATITYRAGDVSRRCSNTGLASSDAGGCPGDLWYYYNYGYELSVYAGNNQDIGQYIVGHGFVESEGICV